MVNEELQKKWSREADEKFPEIAEICKIFSDNYGPTIIAEFFSATKDKANEVLGTQAKLTKVLGLFTETWRLAIKKSLPPCRGDWMGLLSEALFIWDDGGRKSANIDTLRDLWMGADEIKPEPLKTGRKYRIIGQARKKKDGRLIVNMEPEE